MNFLFFKPQNGPPEAEISSDNECNFSPQKPGRRIRNIWLFAFGFFLWLCIWYFSVSVCVYLSFCLCVFLSFFCICHSYHPVCSLSLPADDDYHEFEPAGSNKYRSFLKWTRRVRRVFGRISRISRLYFCISAEVDGANLSPRPPEHSNHPKTGVEKVKGALNDNISRAHPLALIVTSPATHRGRRVRPALWLAILERNPPTPRGTELWILGHQGLYHGRIQDIRLSQSQRHAGLWS